MVASPSTSSKTKTVFLDMTGYQWLVLFAAWLGWGFDVFDSLLFNFVAPTCVPILLGLDPASPAAKAPTLHWIGILTSMLLVGWGIGGIIFGKIADKIGRTKTLLLTMLLYSVGTALCAFAPNIYVLALCRFVASLGIGGEWAAGAAMVAEVVPEKRRVDAGVLLYTAAPLGIFGAIFTDRLISGNFSPEQSWRLVFLCGLIPVAVAVLVRIFVKEPERWKSVAENAIEPKIAELFTPEFRRITISGLLMATVVLLGWWSCNSFLPTAATGIATAQAKAQNLDAVATKALVLSLKTQMTSVFTFGGLIGVLLTIPVAKRLGRKPMFALYFALGAVAVFTTYGFDWPNSTRLILLFFSGVTIFGIFGAFTFYLPELFPTRLRGTGAGFCYNAGRFLTAAGPFVVGAIAASGPDSVLRTLAFTALIPFTGLFLLPFVIETKGKILQD